jgi:dienelactone hydrolase
VRTQDIEYTADGNQMIGHLAVDDSQPGRRPAVLVCHEGSGLDEHAKGLLGIYARVVVDRECVLRVRRPVIV